MEILTEEEKWEVDSLLKNPIVTNNNQKEAGTEAVQPPSGWNHPPVFL